MTPTTAAIVTSRDSALRTGHTDQRRDPQAVTIERMRGGERERTRAEAISDAASSRQVAW